MRRLAMPLSDCAEIFFLHNLSIITDIQELVLLFLGIHTVGVQTHDVGEATIDVGDFACDTGSEVGKHEGGYVADFFDRDITTQGSVLCDEVQQDIEVANAAGSDRFDRTGRNGIDADAFLAKGLSHVTDTGFQRGFCQTHRIVVRNGTGRTKIGQGQCRRTGPHQVTGSLDHGRITVSGDIMGDLEVFAGQAVEKITGNRFTRCKADRVNQPIQTAPFVFDFAEYVFDMFILADISFVNHVAARVC